MTDNNAAGAAAKPEEPTAVVLLRQLKERIANRKSREEILKEVAAQGSMTGLASFVVGELIDLRETMDAMVLVAVREYDDIPGATAAPEQQG
jgi:hypothetical protein